jgi:LmbE family N-acetylglucosaminyl deacetylase
MAAGCGIHAIGYSLAVTEPISNSARLAAQPIAGGGTPVDMWTRWGRRLAPLNFDHCPALILVAAHPDDETLALGADGEAAYPEDHHGREKLGQTRRDELITASACLRLPRPIFLGIPDGEVAANEDRLEVELEAVLAESQPGAWCAATWRGDGHPDHEATGRAAAAASKDVPAVFIEYPVWMWHWALPDDPAVSWDSARRVSLTSRDLATKADALQCFSSQLERTTGPPLLPTAVVERQLAVGEIVFV